MCKTKITTLNVRHYFDHIQESGSAIFMTSVFYRERVGTSCMVNIVYSYQDLKKILHPAQAQIRAIIGETKNQGLILWN